MLQKTKIIFPAILIIILMCFSSVYAITDEQIDYIYDYQGCTFNNNVLQSIKDKVKYYEDNNYKIFVHNNGKTGNQSRTYICFSEETPQFYGADDYLRLYVRYSIKINDDSVNLDYGNMDFYFYNTENWYFPDGVLNKAGTAYYYEPGTETGDWKIAEASYKVPYFEFSANKVGTATFENEDGNINTYYKNSFPIWTNSYGTFREIGNLYIDSKYIWDDIFFPELYITKKNFSQTNQWEYVEYDFFKHEEENQYVRYSINVRNDLITAPYLYEIEILTINSALSDDVNIKFVVINQNDSSGGIIIENNSGDRISGDEIKDTTSLGDINNTINDIFQEPSEEELKAEQEQNINEIKDQLTSELQNNEIMGALTTAEQGFIELLQGEPRRF